MFVSSVGGFVPFHVRKFIIQFIIYTVECSLSELIQGKSVHITEQYVRSNICKSCHLDNNLKHSNKTHTY